ncbi:hypothetical protein NBRC116495_18040 [Aurantivibrio plasticivorans]
MPKAGKKQNQSRQAQLKNQCRLQNNILIEPYSLNLALSIVLLTLTRELSPKAFEINFAK